MKTNANDENAKQEQRKQLRQACRKARNALSSSQQQIAAEQLASQVEPLIQQGDNFALYLANDGEISPGQLVERLWRSSKRVLLSVMHGFSAGCLNFQTYSSDTKLWTNKYGILEPRLNAFDTLALQDIDIIFMPLVSFDRNGNRLGMGGGYYDRTLSGILKMKTRPRLIGLAHDCQESKQLPVESWDIPLDMIITPTQKIFIKGVEHPTPKSL